MNEVGTVAQIEASHKPKSIHTLTKAKLAKLTATVERPTSHLQWPALGPPNGTIPWEDQPATS